MSRFPETVAEAIDQVVIGESLHVEDLAEHIAACIVERQQAVRSEVTIRAKFPVTRRTPVSNMPTQEIYHLIGRALVNGTTARRMVGGRRDASRRAGVDSLRRLRNLRPAPDDAAIRSGARRGRPLHPERSGAGRRPNRDDHGVDPAVPRHGR